MPVSRQADAEMVTVSSGVYISGSTSESRETAYRTYEQTAGHNAARRNRWFDREEPQTKRSVPSFLIDRTPVTVAAYAEFVADTGALPPSIDEEMWKKQGFVQDYQDEVAPLTWKSKTPPANLMNHPVVLVTHEEARAYCHWRGTVVGSKRTLPSQHEFEKASRGPNGNRYPFGDTYDSDLLHGAHTTIRSTVPVGQYPRGASFYGVLGLSGNVFHWTRDVFDKDRAVVKGSAWDDFGGVGRGAARHGRRYWVRHVLVGFRCAGPE